MILRSLALAALIISTPIGKTWGEPVKPPKLSRAEAKKRRRLLRRQKARMLRKLKAGKSADPLLGKPIKCGSLKKAMARLAKGHLGAATLAAYQRYGSCSEDKPNVGFTLGSKSCRIRIFCRRVMAQRRNGPVLVGYHANYVGMAPTDTPTHHVLFTIGQKIAGSFIESGAGGLE